MNLDNQNLFQQAVKPRPWNKTLDALQYKSVCIQMDAGKAIGHEDCLYLNVFTPGNLIKNSVIFCNDA